ncbi:hypothetical protein MHYP_G00301170 [Metynnis hypsauchen]
MPEEGVSDCGFQEVAQRAQPQWDPWKTTLKSSSFCWLSQLLYCCPSDVSSPNLRSAAELKASALPALLILPTKPPDRPRGAQRSRQRPWGGHTTKSRIERDRASMRAGMSRLNHAFVLKEHEPRLRLSDDA